MITTFSLINMSPHSYLLCVCGENKDYYTDFKCTVLNCSPLCPASPVLHRPTPALLIC